MPETDPLLCEQEYVTTPRYTYTKYLLIGLIVLVSELVVWGLHRAHHGKKHLWGSVRLKYEATQFISFTINTLGGLAVMGECDGRPVDENYEGQAVCYLGNVHNLTQDQEHRMEILKQVLQIIKEDAMSSDPEIDRDASVLKIVALPEFFLRGPHGAYSIENLYQNQTMLRISDDLLRLVKDDFFRDYLFVLGTVLFAGTPDTPTTAFHDEEGLTPDDVVYWNFSPIFRGGPTGRRYLAAKKYISTADFLSIGRNRTLPNPALENASAYDAPSQQLQSLAASRGTTFLEDNMIDVDGVKVGIEICLDHRYQVLWNRLKGRPETDFVDVQLITSAGMAIERGPNPIKPRGGVVYLSDGEASSAACVRNDDAPFDPQRTCRVPGPSAIQHIPKGNEFITLSGCIDFYRKKILEGYYSLYQPQGCANTLKHYGINVMDEYKHYPPSIEIYPVIKLPES